MDARKRKSAKSVKSGKPRQSSKERNVMVKHLKYAIARKRNVSTNAYMTKVI